MLYLRLADLTLLAHLGFVVFVVLGGLLVARWPRLAWAHLPAALWGVFVEYSGWSCPLTPLELFFRRRAVEAGYAGGFIEHTVARVLYPAALARGQQILLGTLVLVGNALIYWRLLRRRRHLERPQSSQRGSDATGRGGP
jgi:hypothetical protein